MPEPPAPVSPLIADSFFVMVLLAEPLPAEQLWFGSALIRLLIIFGNSPGLSSLFAASVPVYLLHEPTTTPFPSLRDSGPFPPLASTPPPSLPPLYLFGDVPFPPLRASFSPFFFLPMGACLGSWRGYASSPLSGGCLSHTNKTASAVMRHYDL